MFRTTLISASLVLAGSTAFAGNLAEPVVMAPVPAPMAPMAPSANWTGFYAGGQYITGDVTISDDFDDFQVETDLDGFGIHAGYLYDLGSFVVGGELDYDMTEIDASNLDGNSDVDTDIMRVKAIAGYDLGNFLPYVTAGAAMIDIDDEADDTVGFYGIGGTYQFTDSFRVGGEFLRHDGDDFADSGNNLEADTFSLRASFSF